MSDEKLEPVTDFASLRAGDLVVVKPCRWGDGYHRGLLLRFDPDSCGWDPGGVVEFYPAWTTTVVGFHGKGGCMLVGAYLVRERRLYRVAIPPAEETRETARPKKLERVR